MPDQLEWFPLYIDRLLSSPRWQHMHDYQRGWYIQLLLKSARSERPGFLRLDSNLWRIAGANRPDFFESNKSEVMACFKLREMEGQTWIFNERFVKTIGDQMKKLRKATTRSDASDVTGDFSVMRNADENRAVVRNDVNSASCSYSPGVGVAFDVGSKSLSIEDIYREYPRKVGKRVALTAILKASTRILQGECLNVLDSQKALEVLLDRTKKFAGSLAGQAGEFTPHPSTWFNQSRYLDDEREWNRSRDGYNGNGNHRAPSADPIEDMTVRNHREAITNYAKRGLHFILCNADLCEACANEKRKFPQIITPTQERERERLAAQ
jgi:hypothetical protein